MLDRFRYLIVGTAIISSLVFTVLATPTPTRVVGCAMMIEDEGDSCAFVNENPPDCVYYCISTNRWTSRPISGGEDPELDPPQN